MVYARDVDLRNSSSVAASGNLLEGGEAVLVFVNRLEHLALRDQVVDVFLDHVADERCPLNLLVFAGHDLLLDAARLAAGFLLTLGLNADFRRVRKEI